MTLSILRLLLASVLLISCRPKSNYEIIGVRENKPTFLATVYAPDTMWTNMEDFAKALVNEKKHKKYKSYTIGFYSRKDKIVKFDSEGKITNLSELQFSPNTTKQFLQDWISRYYGTDEGYLISRSFVKLREVVVAYQLPTALVKKAGMQNAVISLTGRNLLYWAERKDVDVEQFIGAPSGSYGQGGSSSLQSPTLRRFGLNLKVTF